MKRKKNCFKYLSRILHSYMKKKKKKKKNHLTCITQFLGQKFRRAKMCFTK